MQSVIFVTVTRYLYCLIIETFKYLFVAYISNFEIIQLRLLSTFIPLAFVISDELAHVYLIWYLLDYLCIVLINMQNNKLILLFNQYALENLKCQKN
jgi:hypothetical protein